MELVLWAFAGFTALVLGVIAVAAWVTFHRDRDQPNMRTKPKRRPGRGPRHGPGRGVPKSR